VREGRAHAALVYDDTTCVGWCQFGSPDELPRIKNKRAYLETPADPPDWRITCFFVDKAYRGRGVAARALEGALLQIARLGGGTVESYPELVEARSVAGAFLHNGTVPMFERSGFERTRPIGKHRWVVTEVVSA
jgi:GNAT superfamily N-acetyltransferase